MNPFPSIYTPPQYFIYSYLSSSFFSRTTYLNFKKKNGINVLIIFHLFSSVLAASSINSSDISTVIVCCLSPLVVTTTTTHLFKRTTCLKDIAENSMLSELLEVISSQWLSYSYRYLARWFAILCWSLWTTMQIKSQRHSRHPV